MEPHMFKQLMCVALLMGSVITQVSAEQGCPYPTMVKYAGKYFHVKDKVLPWQSPKVEYEDFIDRFIGAVFIPGEGEDRKNGYMDKCVYATYLGRVVTLRPNQGDSVINMSLTSTLHWELLTGEFKVPMYICTDSQPDNCAFTINTKTR